MSKSSVLTDEHRARINQMANGMAQPGGTAAEYRHRYRLAKAALTVEVLKCIAAGADPDRLLAPAPVAPQRKRIRAEKALIADLQEALRKAD